jgi:hypothetical protein
MLVYFLGREKILGSLINSTISLTSSLLVLISFSTNYAGVSFFFVCVPVLGVELMALY